MAYSSKAIANKFLELAKNEGTNITQMKLQKLVYISHGYYLAILDKPLISDEIQAWQYGAIISELYHEFKSFEKSPITSLASDTDVDDDFEVISTIPVIDKDDEDSNGLIEAVWEKYKKYSGSNLSDMTHREDTPWYKTYQDGIPNIPINNKLIKEYYSNLINKN
jgi:uncharacterized phage-associated protein